MKILLILGFSDTEMCPEEQFPECLTPTLVDGALSKLLKNIAGKDKHYVGGKVLLSDGEDTPERVPKLVGQT